MKLRYKLCAFICAVLFTCTVAGCVAQPNMSVPDPNPKPVTTTPTPSATPAAPVVTTVTLVQSAKEELAKGEKSEALSFIARAMRSEEGSPYQNEELYELWWLWWNSMADVTDIPKETLTEEELSTLSAVAYIVSSTDCFFDAQELTKEQLLTPLEIYYGMSMTLPLYSRPGWDTIPFRGAYPSDGKTAEENSNISADKANEFVEQLVGVCIPEPEADGEFRGGQVVCQNGTYTISKQIVGAYDYLVSGYRYVGDGLFYVDFDRDEGVPEPGRDKGMKHSVVRLLVQRSSSAWGFTVVSKLEDERGDITLPDVSRPDGMTYLTNRPAFYNEQQFINARAVSWLEQRTKAGPKHQELNAAEIEKLNELASLVTYMNPYFEAEELAKRAFIWTLSFYYQQAFRYNYKTEQYEIEKGLIYPPDGILDTEELALRMFLPVKTAEAVANDILGAGIPDACADYGDPEDEYVVCKDGVYYIWATDNECPDFYLSAYQYLGDDTFYLSFDVDDRWMTGASIRKKGIVADDCRMLVKRTNSEWGFTVVSKLKDEDWTILPDDFPLPQYSTPYEAKVNNFM